jgi:diadenosine tetraphosphatase ApaH/serine/threonine PP2A family protein phosphatase
MLIALFADIHANREAFSAALAEARARGAERFVLLGDFVGYGADPEWTVATVMELAGDGAILVRGNHDDAIGSPRDSFSVEAQIVIEWTRGELGTAQRRFLEALPLTQHDDDRLYVHADASKPDDWRYVMNADDAARSLDATAARVTFCGHVHRPKLYNRRDGGPVTAFTPTTGAAIPLLRGRRWLAVLGAVGQPRDGNPAAAFAMLDTARQELTFCRAAYDIEAAARKIRDNGLPPRLAERLLHGT